MSNQWAVFDDGSVAYISPDQKTLYGFGPNTNQQFSTEFGASLDGFKKIPFHRKKGEIIQGIYAGGSSCFGDHALFVLTVLPVGEIKPAEKGKPAAPDRKYAYPLTRLSCCGTNLQNYFLNSASVAEKRGVFTEIPLPQTKINETDGYTNLPINHISIWQNHIVFTIDTHYLGVNLKNSQGHEYKLPINDDSALWANLSAIQNYSCPIPGMFGQNFEGYCSQALNFLPVAFPKDGDKTARIPEKCVAGEFFIIVTTFNQKAYFLGHNKRAAGGQFVTAIPVKYMSATKNPHAVKGWFTLSYDKKLEDVNNVLITNDSQVILYDHERSPERIINLSCEFVVALGTLPMASYQSNLVLADNKTLYHWGRKISDFLAVSYHEAFPEKGTPLHLTRNEVLQQLPAKYRVVDIAFNDSSVYLLAESEPYTVSVQPHDEYAAPSFNTVTNKAVLAFGVELNLTAIPTLISHADRAGAASET